MPNHFDKLGSLKRLKLIESVSLGDKRSIALIQVEDRYFLLGNTPRKINLLKSFSETLLPISANEERRSTSHEAGCNKNANIFRNLFEVKMKRKAENSGSPYHEDVRKKMNLVREALKKEF